MHVEYSTWTKISTDTCAPIICVNTLRLGPLRKSCLYIFILYVFHLKWNHMQDILCHCVLARQARQSALHICTLLLTVCTTNVTIAEYLSTGYCMSPSSFSITSLIYQSTVVEEDCSILINKHPIHIYSTDQLKVIKVFFQISR